MYLERRRQTHSQPSTAPSMKCQAKDEIGRQVLNDVYSIRPIGTESGFKHNFKNPYEDLLFKVEEDQYELDMMIGRAVNTVSKLNTIIAERLTEQTLDGKSSVSVIPLTHRCQPRNPSRCIEGHVYP